MKRSCRPDCLPRLLFCRLAASLAAASGDPAFGSCRVNRVQRKSQRFVPLSIASPGSPWWNRQPESSSRRLARTGAVSPRTTAAGANNNGNREKVSFHKSLGIIEPGSTVPPGSPCCSAVHAGQAWNIRRCRAGPAAVTGAELKLRPLSVSVAVPDANKAPDHAG